MKIATSFSKQSLLRVIACVARTMVIAAMAWPADAQTTTVRGVVRDEQQAPVPGAAVLTIHAASGLRRDTATDAGGAFELANLPPGVHDVTVTFSGFTPWRQRVEAGN